MFPCGKHPDHFFRNLAFFQEYPEYLVTENGFQLFKLQRRGDAEHPLVAIKTPVRQKDVTVWIESEKIAEGLNGDHGAGDGNVFMNRILEKDLQGFPSRAAQIGKKLPVIEKIPSQNLGNTKDEVLVGYLFEDIHAEPLAEFHHPLLMAGRAEVAAFAGKCQEIFVAAVITSPISSRTSLTRAKPLCRSPQSR